MANKKLNELSSRTPSLTDLALIGDPANGYAYQCTISALQGLFFNVQVTTIFGRSGNVVAAEGDYTLTQLGDVTITTPANGQALVYNGTTWVNATPVNIYTTNSTLTSNRTIDISTYTFNISSGANSRFFIKTNGYVGINQTNPSYWLDVNGEINASGTVICNGFSNSGQNSLVSYATNFSSGEFGTYMFRKYTPTTLRNNISSYSLWNTVWYDLTTASYTTSGTNIAAAFYAQVLLSGNASTKITQPISAATYGIESYGTSTPLNMSDMRHIDIRQIKSGGITGHTIDDVYGIRIGQFKGTSGFTITNGWGIYQEGSSDNNYFNGKVLIGTTGVGASPVRISGLPTSATGLSTGDLWNDAGTIKIK